MKPLLLRDGDRENRRHWRTDLLEERLLWFAPAAALELLGWWVYQEPSFLRGSYDVFDECTTIQEIMAHMSEDISPILNATEDLAYIGPILNALVAGEVPARPSKRRSLLYGPLLDANKRCGLPSCRSTRGAEGGDLLRCTGGCRGLEQYCCKDHQVEDWGRHKAFCQGNR